jgi:hypothetical protein
LLYAQQDSAMLRSRISELEGELQHKLTELREARDSARPVAERTAELAKAEAQVVQRTVERELRAMDEMTIRLERVVAERAAAVRRSAVDLSSPRALRGGGAMSLTSSRMLSPSMIRQHL